jgi:fructan beta-fructosidase
MLLGRLPVTAGILAYEGFGYVSGTLTGQNGGMGWSGGWIDVGGGGNLIVNAGSLLAGSSAPVGYDARSSTDSVFVGSSNRAGRWLDFSTGGNFAHAGYLNTNGNIGAPGKTLYVSFLQQPNSPAQFYEFEFHRANLGDPGRVAGIGNDLPNATTVNLRAPNTVQTPFALGNTNVNFYIVRIDFHGGSDDVYVYVNPTGPDESNNQPALTMLGAADMSFNGISMAAYLNGVTVKHDEIRLGQTWADALGNPPIFLLQPTNQNLFVGQNATFRALAQSNQKLDYQWYCGTNALVGQTNNSLTLSNLQPTDANLYSVVVSNALGTATSFAATLTVQVIGVTVSSPSLMVGLGSNLLVAATIGGAPPITLQWYMNGVPVTGANNPIYSIVDSSVFDAGQYVLVAQNSHGCITSSVVNMFPNFGGLLAYEAFNYGQSNGDIGGANGGFGWAGAWVNVAGGSSQSYSNSLIGGANAPTGYDVRSVSGYLSIANASRKGRYLDCSSTGTFAQHGYLDGNGNIGANGTTLYLSFLQQPSSTNPFYEFEFKRGDLGDDARIGGIGDDLGSGNDDANLRMESPAGGNSTFYDLGPGDTNVNFYVLRIDYQTGNDSVTVYRNPTSATEPATPTLVVSNVADMSFNGISFGAYLNNDTVAHDELRFGMTWADVVGRTVSQLKLAQYTNHTSSLLLAASPNYNYQVLRATNVTGPWANFGQVATSTLGISQFADTNANSPQEYYRAISGTVLSTPSAADIVLADFEQPTYGAWVTTGTAFGAGPAQGTFPNQNPVAGYEGSGLVNSYLSGDASTGTLTSPPFVISKPCLDFLIGGGDYPGQECMNLLVSNVVVATATGADSENLAPAQWKVSSYLGQTATLQIVDSATGSWGHILIDEITLSDTAFPLLSRTMLLTNNLLNLPVKNGATMKRVTVTVGGQPVRDFNIELADGTPDWWAFVDVSAFSNQTATLSVNALAPGNTGLSSVVQTNGLIGATHLYAENLRPQIHFSTKRGWLNDANGMVYNNGQYHLYYQHDPFNWDGSGQKWWGHAVSQDMVNWVEVREGIYSHAYGDEVYSGSAVVDDNNTGGFKTGTNNVVVAAYFSTARGECIAYSNDGGLTFADYSNNPVVVHSVVGRDPHLLWYAPSNYWVMAVYDGGGGNGVEFYSTPDFRNWTYRSKIHNGMYECPDLFQLPVDGNTNNLVWALNDGSSNYQLGQFDGATFTPSTAELPGNLGSGFYASQTFTSMKPGDHRKVRIGWAQISTPGMPFNQLMYFPTELTLQTTASGVRLCSTPIDEITNNAINAYVWTNLNLNPGYNPLSGIRGSLFDLKAQFAANSAQMIVFTFQNVTVSYNASTQQISCNGDTQSLPPINGLVQLEIVADLDTIEIFGNNGQLYMPLPAGNAAGNSLLSLTCTGGTAAFNSLTVLKLKSIWPMP